MSWQHCLAEGFSKSEELLDYLGLPKTVSARASEAVFKTRVPKGFAARMEKGNPYDPLLRQVLASPLELQVPKAYGLDPLNEAHYNPLPGLIHKYQSRVLLTVTGACAINCRYCFRRHFPYEDNNPGRKGWEDVAAYLQAHSEVSEVILSGGDPLLANDKVLFSVFQALRGVPHVKTLRIHSRIPVVLPERLDASFFNVLDALPWHKVLVIHCNHANELSEDVKHVLLQARAKGIHLLNQSVMLKGVNDCPFVLAALSERLFECGVLPYYLHVLDKVAGAQAFEVPLEAIQRVYTTLQTLLPGYLLPKLVQEIPGRAHKSLVCVENNSSKYSCAL